MNTPTNEVKAKLAALYYGQKVLMSPDLLSEFKLTKVSYFNEHKIFSGSYLELRDIASLTDDEAIQVAKLAMGSQWNDVDFKIQVVPNTENIHEDILSVEIQRFINHPSAPKWYMDCHIQIDRVDADINKYAFRNDGREHYDDIIDSESQWAILDYLRSIGIAIPFTYLNEQGKPQTASVPDQINWGWVRIKK